MKKFDYAGLEFEKGKLGNLILYKAELPAKDITGNAVGYSLLYLREDPRKLKNIEIKSPVILKKDVALASDKDFIESCDDSIVAAATLSVYLNTIGRNPFPATLNKAEADLLNRTYASCNNAEGYSVVSFEKSDKNEIEKNNECYVLKIADCNIMNLTERFILASYANSRRIII